MNTIHIKNNSTFAMSDIKSNKKIWDYKKLIIGPSMVFAEHMCGGYFMENLKIAKQAKGLPYPTLIKDMIRPNLFSTYKGYTRYGLPQTMKGFPVLFTQYGVENLIDRSDSKLKENNQAKKLVSGVSGGTAQALFVTPLQRCRSIILTSKNRQNPLSSVGEVIRNEGIGSVMKGWQPTVLKRSADWGLRFYAKSIAEDYLINKKILQLGSEVTKSSIKLNNFEKIQCGVFAGFTGAITVPLDTMVAMTQQYKDKKESSLSIIKNNYQKYGLRSFTRGLGIRMLHTSWHTMFILGVGDIIFSMLQDKD